MKNGRKIDVDRYGGDRAAYPGIEIAKVGDSDCEGLILDSDNYEGEINQIEIAHERTNRRTDALAMGEQAVLRSGLGK